MCRRRGRDGERLRARWQPLQAASGAIGLWIGELAGRFAAAGLAQAEAQEIASTLVTILEGARILARATGAIDRFDETARAVVALVEHRYGR